MAVKTDWIVVHSGDKGSMAYAMECKRCGDAAGGETRGTGGGEVTG